MKNDVKTFFVSLIFLASCSKSKDVKEVIYDWTPENCVSESRLERSAVVGGEKVSNYDDDSKKSVMIYGRLGENSFLCTSTLIAPNVLLTAAHCVGDEHYAIFNTSVSCESGYSFQQQAIKVVAAIKNQNYDLADRGTDRKKSISTDVAILILEKPAPSYYKVFKIADPTKINKDTASIKLIGYGATDFKKGGSGILRKISLVASKVKYDYVNEGLVLLDQTAGEGVCSGDSGGSSLVVDGYEEKILAVNSKVYGASTEAEACRAYAAQAVAYFHLDWIKSAMSSMGLYYNP